MDNKLHIPFTIQSYEVDLWNRLKPFFLQCHIQEAGYQGSEFCNSGYRAMRDHGLSWILNRLHISISKTPLWGDKGQLDTWSRGQVGPLWHRNFRWFDGDGSVIMEGTSAWTVLDIESRSLFRGLPPFDGDKHDPEETLPLCAKLVIPKDIVMEPCGSHTPLFSEIDTNHHVNNCCYTEWAVNSLPFDYLSSHELRDLEVNYYHEVHPDQKVDFLLGRNGDKWYLQGLTDGKVLFLVALEFA